VVLAAGATYYVVSQETASGDLWHDSNTTVTTTTVATEQSAVYGPGGGVWSVTGSVGQTFGPVDFKYQIAIQPLHFNSSGIAFSNGLFRVQVGGGTNQGFIVIEGSTDLLQWSPLRTNAALGDMFEFVDSTNTNMTRRFYRAREKQ
jgi:hypothetical protein